MKSRLYHFMAFEQMLHCALVTAHSRMSILVLLLFIFFCWKRAFLHVASALLKYCLYVGRVVKILWGRIFYAFIINLNNRGSSASDECDIPPGVGAIASAKERVIPSPCARLHRVQDLIEMSADCPLELWSWLVKLSQSCDKIITNREQARRLEGGRNWL